MSPPQLGGLTINGKLTFADKSDLALATEWVMVHGELQTGTEARPHQHKATARWYGNPREDPKAGSCHRSE